MIGQPREGRHGMEGVPERGNNVCKGQLGGVKDAVFGEPSRVAVAGDGGMSGARPEKRW